MSNPLNQVPYLRNSRQFPQESQPLSVELDKTYVDISNAVNVRTIGIFSATKPAINGEAWYVSGENQKQQALRQVFPFTSSALTIAHGINLSQISAFVRIYGTFVDSSGTYYPLPYIDVSSATNQVNIIVNSTNIVITLGGGSPPTLSSGYVVLEWLANP